MRLKLQYIIPQYCPFLLDMPNLQFKQDDFPVAFANQSQILSISLFAELTKAQIERVATLVHSFEDVSIQE